MYYSLAWYVRQQLPPAASEQQRRQLVRQLELGAAGTSLDPTPNERHLLELFVRGHLSIDQVLQYLHG